MEDSFVLQLSNIKFKDFYLCFCGHAKCAPLHNFGPAVRANHIIHYVLSGKGYYYVDDKKYTLEKNYGFLIEPNIRTFYQADSKDPWTYIWVGFSGPRAPEYLHEIGLNHNNLIFKNDNSNEMKELVFKMLKHNESNLKEEFYLQGLLYKFFSLLINDSNISKDSISKELTTKNPYIRDAISFIKNNYSSGITVNDIAKHLSISRSYLYILFNKFLGISPKDYLSNFRVTKSAELLTLTEQSIEEISSNCGYINPESYSAVFKNKFGLTPTKYRKANIDEHKKRLEIEIKSLDFM